MSDIFRGPLIFRNWRLDPNAVAAQSQNQFLSPTFPGWIPSPPPEQAPFIQTDWPVPRGPQRGQLVTIGRVLVPETVELRSAVIARRNPVIDIVAATSQPLGAPSALLVPVEQMPFNQYSWPVPRGPAPIPQDFHASFPLPLQQVIQPNQFDWPVPRGPQPLNRGMVDYILPWAQAPPINQLDWPVPRGPRRNPQDWQDTFKLPLQQTLPLNQYNWPNPPLAARRNPQDWSYTILPNRQPTGAPFFQTDWPVPRAPLRNPQDWRDSFKLPLQQTLPFNEYDWPNPRGPSYGRQDWVWQTSIALSTAVQPPFFQTDWPNPRGPLRGTPDWKDSFKLPLQQTLPFNEYDWPNSRGPQHNPQDWIWQTSIALTAVTQAPFFQTDWPVPRGARRNPQDWSSFNIFTATTRTDPGFNEWGNPWGPQRPVTDWILPQPYVLNTVVGNPIVPIDWPVPRGPRRNPQDWDDSFKLPLQQTLPENQYQWPNPPLAARRNPQDWIQSVPRALASTIPPPIAQYDWPVPKGHPPRQFWTADRFKLPLQQTLPENQYNWPNPVLARKPVVVDWILSVPSTLTFVQPPLNQHDWPNPSLRKGSLLPTWTDWFKLPLQQTLPPRQLDWPNPKGPRQPGVSVLAYLLITQPSPPLPPIYDDRLTLKNEVRRTRELSNKTGRVRFLKNEIRR